METLTAALVAADLSQFCPVTNFYECSDGQWLLVTVASLQQSADATEVFGIRVPAGNEVQLTTKVAVFLSDADQNVLDADGDETNGMTPLATPDVDNHADALAALGYELIGGDA